jgi:hypothetical protein
LKLSTVPLAFLVFVSLPAFAEEKSFHDLEQNAKHRAENAKPRLPYLVDLKNDKSIEATDDLPPKKWSAG